MSEYEYLSRQLSNLIAYYPPPFIFIHDPSNLRQCGLAVQSVIQDIREASVVTLSCAILDGISCFTPRLLYDTALNQLADWTPDWESGCSNWAGPSDLGQRFNENFDGFIHGLKSLKTQLAQEKSKENPRTEYRTLLVVQHADRLKENMSDLIVSLTRLAELTQMDITTVFLSNLRWDQMKPSLGASPEPYYIDVAPITKEATLDRLASLYPDSSVPLNNEVISPETYHPELKQLYIHFLDTLYGICSPFTTDPDELAYIAAARWPGFVKPVLDGRRELIDAGHSEEEVGFRVGLEPRLQLTKLFNARITDALHTLYPRHTSALEWAKSNIPSEDILTHVSAKPPAQMKNDPAPQLSDLSQSISRMAKFILVAAFLASTNPAKSDLRMFGRGPDERKRKRRRGGTVRRIGKSGAVKIPQRLLGPIAFPLDRLIAILGVLLEENDADKRPPAPEYTIPGEYTEMEISRVAIYSQVVELTEMDLLHRTSPADRLEISPMFRCGITYNVAQIFATEIGISNIHELMWEPA
ncbi:hypothetical protein QCA50_004895 [Cerrena zonata]|uniref:Origin recognition complex subunit 5 n=1 Tax=Cerrena zonata TaxID=2478898 RepID=A0AAW0GFG3_9APHY